jgi:hypothetical protein
MGPGTQDCNTSGGNCSYTANATSAPPNAVSLGAGTIDRLKVQVSGSVGSSTTRNYQFLACYSLESGASLTTPTFATTCTTLGGGAGFNLGCVIQGNTATGGSGQTSAWSCTDNVGTLGVPPVSSNAEVLFWIEAVASGTAPNAVQATWSARFVGQSTNQ